MKDNNLRLFYPKFVDEKVGKFSFVSFFQLESSFMYFSFIEQDAGSIEDIW